VWSRTSLEPGNYRRLKKPTENLGSKKPSAVACKMISRAWEKRGELISEGKKKRLKKKKNVTRENTGSHH